MTDEPQIDPVTLLEWEMIVREGRRPGVLIPETVRTADDFIAWMEGQVVDSMEVTSDTSMPLREHEIVRLTKPFTSPAGIIPEVTEGTVLQVYDHGVAYQVEFEGSGGVPETVPAAWLERIDALWDEFFTAPATAIEPRE